ncbi:Sorbitol dehydrogenase [Schizosaccharomyces pombe]|uniref:Sorbitol dehydrogenase n=1 Tax=Schizosaccharomyces pombe (strain 972 / ATCC 24843) TaxID=284812 RepID=DHSO_SCHPO|nr:putative hexitol dehydrogenase [Schizosaccharomyces pombe]P36624.2 RecName: Full=Sorbitol dehydrogenase; Short=SDH; AltName: Full=Polyol dehydrogenase; AltName: Full=Protein tms1 [Schizosaccharomyces pombe 972h-]CAA21910.1 hexitol dehydrogenase (predicted) [Schizosaccharomyces pombe]|eukprot:NP_595120.1 putative hexitol dehydrogenase [Schizosaccharomyces pombe]
MAPAEKAFVLRKKMDTAIEDRPGQTLTDDHQVKVAIKATGICGSDVHYWKEGGIGDFILKKPMILGHESAGVVVEVGKGVSSLKPGDPVAVEPGCVCRLCDYCRSGRYNLCPHMEFAATPPYDGTLRTYYITTEDFCTKLPKQISVEEGALFEPMSVAVHAMTRGNLKCGSRVLVMGCGTVGLLMMAVAKAYGAIDIVAVDASPSRVEFAQKYVGAKPFTPIAAKENESLPDYAQRYKQAIIEKYGEFDFAVDATGVGICIHTAVLALKRGGTFVQAGNGKPVIDFPINHIINYEINVLGSFRYAHGCYKQSLFLVSNGLVDVKPLITHRFAFKDALKAYETVASGEEGVLKVIIGGPDA